VQDTLGEEEEPDAALETVKAAGEIRCQIM
jgi:hypothetical protein